MSSLAMGGELSYFCSEAMASFHTSERHSHFLSHQLNTLPVKNGVMNVSQILSFDVDAFAQNKYASPEEEARAKLIIKYIQEHKHDGTQLFISEDHPNEFYRFLINNTVIGRRRSRTKEEINKYKESPEERKLHFGRIEKLLSVQRASSFHHLLSKRHLWYSWWKKRTGITIQEGNDAESHAFQRDVTLLLIYIDIIGAILFRYHAVNLDFRKDPIVELLINAHAVALSTLTKTETLRMTESTHSEFSPPSRFKIVKKARKTYKKKFPIRVGNSACRVSTRRVWEWIVMVIKDYKNESFNKIFFKEDGYTLRCSIQTTFNSIFLHTIPQLNQRLMIYEERYK
jgi:hypothetical protein